MPKDDDKDANRRSALMYGAALSIFFSVLTCFGIGWALDRWLKTAPWFVVGGIVLGSVLGFYQFIRLTSKIDD